MGALALRGTASLAERPLHRAARCTGRARGPTLTLQAAELPGAVLPRDMLPVGAAGQGHHGAQRGSPLAHLHLELQRREERSMSVIPGLEKTWQGTGALGVSTSLLTQARPVRHNPREHLLELLWKRESKEVSQGFLPVWFIALSPRSGIFPGTWQVHDKCALR